MDRVKARVIAEHCAPLDPEQTQDLQDLVLPGVEELTTSELRDVAGQAVIIVDPDGAENRHQEAAARRELRMQPGPDGMATLKAHLPADGAVKIFQVSDLLATGTAGTPGDNRGIGARRVDALVDIADHLLTHGFVDLTDYLGEELPDHGTPTPRRPPAPAPAASTNPSGNDSTGEGAEPAVDTDATGTDTAQPENGGATGDDAAAEVPDHTEAPATESAATDNDSPAATDDTTVGPMTCSADRRPSTDRTIGPAQRPKPPSAPSTTTRTISPARPPKPPTATPTPCAGPRRHPAPEQRAPRPPPVLPHRVRLPSGAAGTGCSPGRAAARTCPSPSG